MSYPTPVDQQTTNYITKSETQTVPMTGSPFVFTNPQSVRCILWITGGTVTAVSRSSDLLGVLNLGILGGEFLVNPGDSVTITYLLAPTVRYWCT